MAERQRAMVNRVADGLVQHFKNHARDNPEKWFVVPATIERGVSESSEARAMPSIFVTAATDQRAEEIKHGSGSSHYRRRKPLVVTGACDGGADREDAIEELVADVRRAIVANLQLADVDGDTPVLQSGQLFIKGDTTGVEMSEGGAARSWFVLELDAVFQWDENSP